MSTILVSRKRRPCHTKRQEKGLVECTDDSQLVSIAILCYIYICIRTHTCMHTYMHTYIALLHGIAWHYMLAFHAYMNTYVICM